MKNIILMTIVSTLLISCEDKNEKADQDSGDPSWNYEWVGSQKVTNSDNWTLPGGLRTVPKTSEAQIEILIEKDNKFDTGNSLCPDDNFDMTWGEYPNVIEFNIGECVDLPCTLTKGVDFFADHKGDGGFIKFYVGCSPGPYMIIKSVKLTSK